MGSDGSFKLWDLVSLRSLTEDSLSPTMSIDAQALPKSPSLAMTKDLAITASFIDGRLVKWSLKPDDWIAAPTIGTSVMPSSSRSGSQNARWPIWYFGVPNEPVLKFDGVSSSSDWL